MSTSATRSPGIDDSTHGTDAPILLVSPSGCVGATDTASGQPSSDDHVDEAGLPAIS
jgi:hypothetical protein